MGTLSETLWRAANEHLWDGASAGHFNDDCCHFIGPGETYSCDAIGAAESGGFRRFCSRPARDFLTSLGLPVDALNAFDEFKFGRQRQGARYLWLMFASLVAEEAGL